MNHFPNFVRVLFPLHKVVIVLYGHVVNYTIDYLHRVIISFPMLNINYPRGSGSLIG
jgi:hypothetical protein